MEKKNSIIRVITMPLMLIILLFPAIVLYLKWVKAWFLYGGEIVHYQQKDESKSVYHVYEAVKNHIDELKINKD